MGEQHIVHVSAAWHAEGLPHVTVTVFWMMTLLRSHPSCWIGGILRRTRWVGARVCHMGPSVSWKTKVAR